MDNEGGVEQAQRTKVYEKSDGSRRWVWAPTRLEQQDEKIPQVEEPPNSGNEDVAEEKSTQPHGSGDVEMTQHSDQETVKSESDHSKSDEESPRATFAMESTHTAMFYSEQRENRR